VLPRVPAEGAHHRLPVEPERSQPQAQLSIRDRAMSAADPSGGELEHGRVELGDALELLGRRHPAVPFRQQRPDAGRGVVHDAIRVPWATSPDHPPLASAVPGPPMASSRGTTRSAWTVSAIWTVLLAPFAARCGADAADAGEGSALAAGWLAAEARPGVPARAIWAQARVERGAGAERRLRRALADGERRHGAHRLAHRRLALRAAPARPGGAATVPRHGVPLAAGVLPRCEPGARGRHARDEPRPRPAGAPAPARPGRARRRQHGGAARRPESAGALTARRDRPGRPRADDGVRLSLAADLPRRRRTARGGRAGARCTARRPGTSP